jgi:hypothetical protein
MIVVNVLGAGGNRAGGDADSVVMQGSRRTRAPLSLGERPLDCWQQQGEARDRILQNRS